MVDIAIISGSKSDQLVVDKILQKLNGSAATYEHKVLSAHRNPNELDQYISGTDARIFIGIAGLSAALPGVIASKTARPVIGVPVSAKLGGLDSLLSIVQMPPGVPVACVGIDNGENAALLALRILESGR
jgi:5-(carboxyamino)imidazole ribonucleotide mutase